MSYTFLLKQDNIYSGNTILQNGQPLNIPFINLVTTLVMSIDLQSLYIASSTANYIRKYNNTLDGWVADKSFNVEIDSLFPMGLLLNDSDLYISFADNFNNSKIMKVSAATGRQYYDPISNLNKSTIYNSSTEALSAMVTDGTYLYVANSGNYNNGRTINRISLADNTITVGWASGLNQAPIQLCIYKNYLCVLQSSLTFSITSNSAPAKQVVLLNLTDGSIATTFVLHGSENLNLGLSLVISVLNLINSNGNIVYSIDLENIIPFSTNVLHPIAETSIN